MPTKIKRRTLSTGTILRISKMRCVICGDSGDIDVDHILPVSQGGGNEISNLQPLCHQCHAIKGSRKALSNKKIQEVYLADVETHHLKNRYRMTTRFMNSYDAPTFKDWKQAR